MTASSIDRSVPDLVTVDVTRSGATSRVSAVGEIDSTSAPVLRARLESELDAGVDEIVVDLSGVTFLDSAGLCVLASVFRRAEADGRRFRVLASSRAVIRPLQITGLWDLLHAEKVVPGAHSAA